MESFVPASPSGYAGILRLLELASHSFFEHLLGAARSGETEQATCGTSLVISMELREIRILSEHKGSTRKNGLMQVVAKIGAGDGARTPDLQLGKLAFYH